MDDFTRGDFELGIFRYGFRLRFTIMIDSHSAHLVVNGGPIHNGEIENVTFNGALHFASFYVYTGLGSKPLPNPGNTGFHRQTIL